MQAASWGVEGLSMLLLLLPSLCPSLLAPATFQKVAYFLSLLGVGLPLLKLVYEAVLAPCGSYVFMCIDGKARKNIRKSPHPYPPRPLPTPTPTPHRHRLNC